MLRLNTQERIKLVFKDTNGVFKTGLLASDFLNDRVKLIKGDGSTTYVNLVLATNLIEIDSINSPGIYEIILSTTDTNTLGQLAISIIPTASAFVPEVYLDSVHVPLADIYTSTTDTYSRIGAPVSTSISSDIANVQTTTTAIQGVGFSGGTDDLHSISGSITTSSSNVTAIKAKTDNLPSDPASQSSTETAITNSEININTYIDFKFDEIEGSGWNSLLDNLHQVQLNLATIQTTLNNSVAAIEGSGFNTITDSLKVIRSILQILILVLQ